MAKFFTAFDSKPPRPSLVCPLPEETDVQQHFKNECDINEIIRRSLRSGRLPDPEKQAYFGDFTERSLAAAYAKIADAEDRFASLPAKLRERFEQDPVKLVAFVHDERNRDEAIELGLIPKPDPVPATEPEKASEA